MARLWSCKAPETISAAEALEWGDSPNMSYGFKALYDATGIDTLQGQSAWHEWVEPYRSEYESRPRKRHAYSESMAHAVQIWQEMQK